LASGTLPSAMTARLSSGNSSTSSVYGPRSADHNDSHSWIDSMVQNDHNTTMNQKIA
jgi:hypothetical protein